MALVAENIRRGQMDLLPLPEAGFEPTDHRQIMGWPRVEPQENSFFFWRQDDNANGAMVQEGDASGGFVSQRGAGGTWAPQKDYPEQ